MHTARSSSLVWVLLLLAVLHCTLLLSVKKQRTLTFSPSFHLRTDESWSLDEGEGADGSRRCFDWNTNVDEWWTHRPEWTLSSENDTHQCFSVIENEEKRDLFRRLYRIQFESNCSESTTTKEAWSTGWGADFHNLNDGLLHALKTSRPVPVWGGSNGWHYASKKDGTRPVCPARDMSCYFLNLSACAARPDQAHNGFLEEGWRSLITAGDTPRWLYEYATRTQTWLRRATYDFAQTVPLTTPCTAMHVRRADVVLHRQTSRKYHPIREYVDAGMGDAAQENGESSQNNILLLTDDQNAVDEALSEFPQYHWMYIERPRYKGAEGGWEGHIPSDDPKRETIMILSIFRHLVPQCTKLIHSTSNFADYMFLEMPEGSVRVNIDDGKDDVFSASNSATANLSSI